MTAPVKEIDGSEGVGRRKRARERFWLKGAVAADSGANVRDDSVMISEEARLRASGRYRKNILEHLEEED